MLRPPLTVPLKRTVKEPIPSERSGVDKVRDVVDQTAMPLTPLKRKRTDLRAPRLVADVDGTTADGEGTMNAEAVVIRILKREENVENERNVGSERNEEAGDAVAVEGADVVEMVEVNPLPHPAPLPLKRNQLAIPIHLQDQFLITLPVHLTRVN